MLSFSRSFCFEHRQKKFLSACENGDFEAVKTMIARKNYELYFGFILSYRAGHTKIVELFIQTYQTEHHPDGRLNHHMTSACESGHVDVIKLFIPYVDNRDIDDGFWLATCKGHLNVVEFFVSIGGGLSHYNICRSIYGASLRGYLNIVKFLYELIKDHKNIIALLENCMLGVRSAYGGVGKQHIEVIKFLASKGGNLGFLRDTENFKLYCVYCRQMKIKPQTDKHMNKLVKKYPVFSLLFKKNGPTKRLPIEMLRLLHTYL